WPRLCALIQSIPEEEEVVEASIRTRNWSVSWECSSSASSAPSAKVCLVHPVPMFLFLTDWAELPIRLSVTALESDVYAVRQDTAMENEMRREYQKHQRIHG